MPSVLLLEDVAVVDHSGPVPPCLTDDRDELAATDADELLPALLAGLQRTTPVRVTDGCAANALSSRRCRGYPADGLNRIRWICIGCAILLTLRNLHSLPTVKLDVEGRCVLEARVTRCRVVTGSFGSWTWTMPSTGRLAGASSISPSPTARDGFPPGGEHQPAVRVLRQVVVVSRTERRRERARQREVVANPLSANPNCMTPGWACSAAPAAAAGPNVLPSASDCRGSC